VSLGLSDMVSSSVSHTGVELGSVFVRSGVRAGTVDMAGPRAGYTGSVVVLVST